jgi:hypothetical protein
MDGLAIEFEERRRRRPRTRNDAEDREECCRAENETYASTVERIARSMISVHRADRLPAPRIGASPNACPFRHAGGMRSGLRIPVSYDRSTRSAIV